MAGLRVVIAFYFGAEVAMAALYLLSGRGAGVLTVILAGTAINPSLRTVGGDGDAVLDHGIIEGSQHRRSLVRAPVHDRRLVVAIELRADTGRTDAGGGRGARLGAVATAADQQRGSVRRRQRRARGIIAFIGLLAPYLMRPLVGNQPGQPTGAAAAGGQRRRGRDPGIGRR